MEDFKIPLTTTPNAAPFRSPVQHLLPRVQRKKHVMSLMDILLTLFIVTPLIVGQWRGTWDLMDHYAKAFPAWESFLFGGCLHLSFAIMRDGLQELIQFRANTWWKEGCAYALRRMYTYFFAAACIMNWRGGWIIFDEWLSVESLPDGRAKKGPYVPVIVGVAVVSVVLLGVARSLRNCLAAPFVVGLDTKSSAFDFPTRFRISGITKENREMSRWPSDFGLYKNGEMKSKGCVLKAIVFGIISAVVLFTISYTVLYMNTQTDPPPPSAAKLTSVSVEPQVLEHISPRPFMNDLRGSPPSGFFQSTVPSRADRDPKEGPHNIQEILRFLMENAGKDVKEQHFGNSDSLHGYPQDPFFPFKPQDPSDINLLAPSSFRFAPAALDQKKTRPTRPKKPLSLTLNIYPSSFETEENGRRAPIPIWGHRSRAGLNRPNANKMVVHLNLYPNKGKEDARRQSGFSTGFN